MKQCRYSIVLTKMSPFRPVLPVLLALLVLVTALSAVSDLSARTWADLKEPELLGSAKEGRMTGFVLGSYENWTNEKRQKRTALSLFFIFNATWYPKYDSVTFFPLYHRLASKIDDRRETIFFPLFWRQYENAENDFLLTPLTYYNKEDGDTTTVIGPYLAWWKNYETQDRPSYRGFGLFPLFHLGTDYGWQNGKTTVEERSLYLFPLFSYFEWSENRSLHLFPAIPFIYYHKSNDSHYGNGRFTANRKTFLIPFYSSSYATEDGSSWSFNILPFIYSSGRSFGREDRGFFTHLFPFFYYDSEEDADHRSRSILFPSIPFLFYSKSMESKDTASSTLFILPFYRSSYWRKDGASFEEESAHAFIPLYSYSSRNDRSRLWVFPVFFHRNGGEGGTTSYMLFPFFFKSYTPPSADSEEETALWAIPFYKWKDSVSHGSHFVPLYWYERGGESDLTMLTPLYWNWRNGDTHKQAGPLFYTSRWKEDVVLTDEPHKGLKERREYSTTWLFNYYSWNHRKSEGFLFFPLRYRASDRLKEYDLYIPLTFSTNQSLAKIENGGLYLDSDYSIGYDVFSVSTRLPIIDRRIPDQFKRTDSPELFDPDVANDTTSKTTEPVETAEGPTVTRGKDIDPFDRTNTSAYMGWRALFGWTSYVRADSRRHFRILPLAWLSWNEADENEKMTFLFPLYLNYKSEEEQYMAFFPALLPVYGAYNKGESFVRVYGGPLYITSYDEELKESETSILWPFFKRYSSPEESGHRLFPVYSARTEKTEDGERFRTFSWLHYGSSKTVATADETRTTSSFFSPLYLSGAARYQRKGEEAHRSAFHFFPIPLFTYLEDDARDDYNVLLLFGLGNSEDGSYNSFYALPLFYNSREATDKGDRTNTWIANLFHSYNDPEEQYREQDVIWPIFHSYSATDREGWRLFPLFAHHRTTQPDTQTVTHYSPLHYSAQRSITGEHASETISFWLLNLYHSETYDSRTRKEDDRWLIWPLFRLYKEVGRYSAGCDDVETDYRLYPVVYYTYESKVGSCKPETEHTFFMLPAIYMNRTETTSTDFLLGYYRDSGKGYGFHNLLYLADFEYDADSVEFGLAFHAVEYRSSKRGRSFELLWGLAADWQTYNATTGQYARPGGYDFRLLNYFQRNNSHEHGREFKTALWPVYSYYSDENETSFWFLPTLSYHERKKGYAFDSDLAYLLWFREKDEQRHIDDNYILAGTIYRQYRKDEQGYKSRGSFWGWLWEYETEDDTGYEKFSILKGLIYRSVEHPAGNRRYAKALIFIPLYDKEMR